MDKNKIKKLNQKSMRICIVCLRDGSADYSKFTESLMGDSKSNGTQVLLNSKVTEIKKESQGWKIT